MKKSILFSALALGMGLFSCSQEDLSGNASQAGQPVTVNVKLPDGAIDKANSRYIPSASDDGHQLRCILLVTNGDDNSTIRIEKVESEAVNQTFSFTFTPTDPTNYKCAFWADFIADNALATGDGDEKRYADLYYNTQNLPTVSYNTDVATSGNLFNNDDCDAYCGTIPTGGSLSVTLKRPFARISFNDSGETITTAEAISISGYQVYGSFNIESNEVSNATEISCSNIEPADKENDKTWFYNYLFVGNSNALPDDDETFSMTVDNETKTVSFENDLTSLTSNTKVNASFDWDKAESDGSINISVDFTTDWDATIDPNAPKVGQFLQKDGTFSDTYDAENSIAIVFAAGAKGNDAVTNYGDRTETEIWGYAMGLTSVARTTIFNSTEEASVQTFPSLTNIGSAPWAEGDYAGYGYTQEIETAVGEYSSLLFAAYDTWKTSNDVSGITNVSGWYIPSARQLLDLIGLSYGYAGGNDQQVEDLVIDAITQNAAMSAAVTASHTGNTSYFGTRSNGTAYVMSSYVRESRICSVTTSVTDETETITQAGSVNLSVTNPNSVMFAIRPVLTIFKPAE